MIKCIKYNINYAFITQIALIVDQVSMTLCEGWRNSFNKGGVIQARNIFSAKSAHVVYAKHPWMHYFFSSLLLKNRGGIARLPAWFHGISSDTELFLISIYKRYIFPLLFKYDVVKIILHAFPKELGKLLN